VWFKSQFLAWLERRVVNKVSFSMARKEALTKKPISALLEWDGLTGKDRHLKILKWVEEKEEEEKEEEEEEERGGEGDLLFQDQVQPCCTSVKNKIATNYRFIFGSIFHGIDDLGQRG
jgi:hypothetical protein